MLNTDLPGARSSLRFTTYTLTFICVFMLLFQEYWRGWRAGDHPFKFDRAHYYSYLPALFITGNFDFPECPDLTSAPNGNKIPKVTYGMALMYSPFFMLGHKVAINTKSPLTGYSAPYSTLVHYGSLFYMLAGFYVLACVLRRFFSDVVIAATIACLFFGTNIFHYCMREGEMAHIYCFLLISAIMLLTCKWHENQKNITLVWMGFLVGLLSLIRPTEVLILLFFLFYGVTSFGALWEKLKMLLLKHYKGLILFSVAAFIMWIPQMIFWKKLTDSFLFFSYGDNEKFFWLDPKITNVLFGYRKGLFIYTPMMLLAMAGFFLLRGKLAKLRFGSILYFLLNVYVVSSWWCWWYGGGFGMRALIQSFAVLSIPLAAYFEFVFTFDYQKFFIAPLLRFFSVLCISAFLVLNIVQTYQYHITGMIHWDSMTREAYWYAFDKFNYVSTEDAQKLNGYLVAPDYDAAMKGKRD